MKTILGRLKLESRLLLLFGLAFGVLALVAIPPVSTFDAPGHYYRALQIERGDFRAKRFSAAGLGAVLPERYTIFCETLWNTYWPGLNFGSPSSWAQVSAEAEKAKGRRPIEFTNIADYSPANYVFQSLGMGLAALLSPSPLFSHRAGCLFNLAGYLLLVILALERTPRFERGILLMATSPLLFVLSATLSGDSINFSLPLFALAWVWHLRLAAPNAAPRALLVPLGLGLAIAVLKPSSITALICFAFIPDRHFGSIRKKMVTLWILGVLAVFFWWLWNRAYFDLEIAQWLVPGHPPAEPMKTWFLHAPWKFLPVLGRALSDDLWRQWPFFYSNVGGWVDLELYRCLAPFSLVFLVAFLGCDPGKGHRDLPWAGALLLQSLALFSLTSLMLWLCLGEIGTTYVPGLGGRYFFFVYLGLGIAWVELTRGFLPRIRPPLFWLGLGTNATALAVILVSTAIKVWP